MFYSLLLIAAIAGMLVAIKKWQALPVEKRKGFGLRTALWSAAVIILALVFTGRAHWLMGVLAALIALAGRAVQLAQYAPIFKKIYGEYNSQSGSDSGAKEGGDQQPSSYNGVMTPREAAELLGIDEGASKEEVRQAHKRLMQKVHPDRGGSDALARQLNAAKDMLLK